ncbi:DUF2231 domain-containing protein [Yinghuangia seranimata]|uniref:DUF2231 domain-containing protein n=1 Tax=Yinghuangia seranimata TaxID=408067 RepID=UPI00248D06B7|nr:DUF2231 domain-containing protein [Yinghuangia seranimata]MDI2129033.1 DUF2231 domain-containing protein [Yinghuangia seranimata]
MKSKAAIAGHPIHPMLVGFPVAAYIGSLVGYAVYAGTGHQFWLNFAIALNVAGVGAAVLAALPGAVDLLLVVPSKSPAQWVGRAHAGFNVVSLALFSITLGVYASHWNGPPRSASLGVTLAAIGVATTLAAGALGWSLVQDYHVGIRETDADGARWTADTSAARPRHGQQG